MYKKVSTDLNFVDRENRQRECQSVLLGQSVFVHTPETVQNL